MTPKKMAKQIAKLYQQHVISRNMQAVKRAARLVETPWEALSKTDRAHFKRAAHMALALEATPREFVISQFKGFDELSRRMGRYVMPLPSQLSSLGAQIRYVQYKGQQSMETDRHDLPKSRMAKEFFSENRKLSALAKRLRTTEEEVLASQPETFTEAFLRARGVWSVVADQWRDKLHN